MASGAPARSERAAVAPQPVSLPLRLATGPGPAMPRPDAARVGRGRVRLLAAADAVALLASLVAAYAVAEAMAPPAIIAPDWAVPLLAAAGVGIWIAVFAAYRLYEGQTSWIAPTTLGEVGALFHALLAGSLLFLVLGQAAARMTDTSIHTPVEALLMLLAALVLVPLARAGMRAWVLPSFAGRRRLLVVGAGPAGRSVGRKVSAHPEYGLELVGYVDDDPDGEAVLGGVGDITRLVDGLGIDWVILAASEHPYAEVLDAVRNVRRPDVHMAIVPSFFELFASNATLEDLEGMPVVSLPAMRLSRTARAVKRGVDLAVSVSALLLLAPLLAAIAAIVKLDTPGPVLFRQARHGRGGRPFQILKFRTMVDGAERQRFDLVTENEVDGPLFKIREDPRITRSGTVLRRWSLDELPQLWNVLRGQMSLVGPRPFVIHESDKIAGWASRRLDTTPGITGQWQVSGRNDVPFEEMVMLDYVYVTNWSLWWDIKILFRTVPAVLARKGAY